MAETRHVPHLLEAKESLERALELTYDLEARFEEAYENLVAAEQEFDFETEFEMHATMGDMAGHCTEINNVSFLQDDIRRVLNDIKEEISEANEA